MAILTFYVNTASTPGGDGTTNGTSGATRAFASLSEAEAGLQRVTSDTINIFCDGGIDTAPVTVDGWTISAPGSLNILAAKPHGGRWNDNIYRLSVTDSASTTKFASLDIKEDRVVVDGLQIGISSTTSNSGGSPSCLMVFNCTVSEITVRNCFFRKTGGTWTTIRGVQLHTATVANAYLYNNLFAGTFSSSFVAATLTISGGVYFSHNSLAGGNTTQDVLLSTGITEGKLYFSNNLLMSTSENITVNPSTCFNASSDYNVCSLNGTATHLVPGSHSKKSSPVNFADAASLDLRTSDITAQVDNNLYAYANCPVTTGVEGNVRPPTGLVFAGAWEQSSVNTLASLGQI